MSKDVKNDEQQIVMGVGDKQIWVEREQETMFNIVVDDDDDDDANESSILYNNFPQLNDFPCMSSSSSSSSRPPKKRPISATSSCSSAASSSSSAVSWAVLRSDNHAPPGAALSSTASMEEDGTGDINCIDVMENLGYMDLIDGSDDVWDPSLIFQSENHQGNYEQQVENDYPYFLQGNSELGEIFFEWLKQNKDYISAEDMKNIKLKRSTIENASKRLGSTKEGKQHLLKLILEWVEKSQLQKRRMRELETGSGNRCQQFPEPVQNPNPSYVAREMDKNSISSVIGDVSKIHSPSTTFNCSSVPPPTDQSGYFSPSPWVAEPRPVYAPEWGTMVAPPGVFSPGMGYIGDSYSQGGYVPPQGQNVNANPYLPLQESQAMESGQYWQPSQYTMPMPSQYAPFSDNGSLSRARPPPQASLGSQYPYQVIDGNGEGFVRLGSSATKEARKKRMARQRRLSVHYYRHQTPANQNQSSDQCAGITGANCTSSLASPSNWVYWSSANAPSVPAMAVVPSANGSQPIPVEKPPVQHQNYRPTSSARRQGWKTEKNLKFLLQKVLKQSDVGNLGRIVLPKKEAEIHLPELDSRDGIPIAMEDIGTSRIWNMRYRFWPNNKSRMYLLENTGDFVLANGLQEGDFIVLYSDIKCGKYLIRGVKVRQPGLNSEGKKPVRKNIRSIAPSLNASSLLLPIKQMGEVVVKSERR